MKRYLGLDLGSKTVGVAISESGIIASTLTTLRFIEDKYEDAAAMVLKLIKEHKIDIVVLGLPKHMNNDIGIRGKISEAFKVLLEKETQADIILWDERMSTQTARKVMIQGSERRKTQKDKKDELAAVIILQNYLNYKGA
ncbi:MAG: crossover junction endodeoxyribonuclease RuvA [Tenericutes bacterium GWC2_34_14]|nr:MAG: crossover junction endodeoxyribonuclease RuvA [Tenericutes bacterium GWA2_35_7]OHE28472.1 MAG: crossover junction endodeoxyribonuclease RuvA [Tenericutes bacterium GWC2_34_14]OHE33620.1 MAG: crossover junction endodeoxyribonuclease RuvA [Tenericutes bacterium GWE2_34_108]OHE36905.1 MAG: crossover junction endodeoxyribonuclease RuvA [Tenericutes bacterium GWF1_35_14]OHE38015.1 MAG: crossover junction endodeoxyribonuclease RuvA [Tenericutes bacterium GWF2_35_184]OHE43468.1 MAG: crossover